MNNSPSVPITSGPPPSLPVIEADTKLASIIRSTFKCDLSIEPPSGNRMFGRLVHMPNKLEILQIRTSAPYSPIACRLSSSQAPDGLSVLTGRAYTTLPVFFPELIRGGGVAQVSSETGQDNPGRNADVFPNPIRIVVRGRRTAMRVGRSVPLQCEGPLSFSNFLRLLLHEVKSFMERVGKNGKVFGVFKNERRTSSVRNSSTEDRASWSLPVGSRTNTPRFP